MMRALILAAAMALTSGCASTFPAVADLKPTPADRVFTKEARSGEAIVTLLRTKEFLASGVNFRVLSNGQQVAAIGWAEWLSFPVPIGEVILEIRHPLPILGVSGDAVAFAAMPNGRYYFRVISGVDGPRLLRTTESSANGQ